jgi:hypothetical protein
MAYLGHDESPDRPRPKRSSGAPEVLEAAAALIREKGHATNATCHEYEGERGYCVGWAIATASARLTTIVGEDYAVWREARRFMAEAWGFPFDWGQYGSTEEASVPANEYAVEKGIDPVPFIENAAALARGENPPHAGLPAIDAWPRCETCGKNCWDGEYCSEECLMGGGR